MMFDQTGFGRQIDILQRTMDASLLRQNVIANNIANVNTPNFKRGQVNFESRLAHALASERREPRFREALTDEAHIPFHETLDYRDVRPRRVTDLRRPPRTTETTWISMLRQWTSSTTSWRIR
jgi:flagellar basal-body rod protein FlgB